MIASHHVGQNRLSPPNSSGGTVASKFQTSPASASAALAFSTLTGAQILSQQQHSAVASGPAVGVSVGISGGNGGGGGFKPKREQVAEFFKMVKDGKINEVNQALKTNQQLALSHDEKQVCAFILFKHLRYES